MKGIMTQIKSLLHTRRCYPLEKEHLVLRRYRCMKMNTKLIASGAICPNQPKKKSTDNKQAEHINDDKLHFEILYLQLTKLLRISYLEHKTNDWVRSKINFLVDPQEPLLATVKRRKLAWLGQTTRHDSLPKIILLGIFEGCL